MGVAKLFTAASKFKDNFVLNVLNYRVHKLSGTTLETIADVEMLNASAIGVTIRNLFVKIQYQENKAWFDLATSPVVIPVHNIIANKKSVLSIKLNYSILSFPFALLKPIILGQTVNIRIISKFEVAGVTQTIENTMPLAVPSAVTSLVRLLFPNLKGLGNTSTIPVEAPKQNTDSTPPSSQTKYQSLLA